MVKRHRFAVLLAMVVSALTLLWLGPVGAALASIPPVGDDVAAFQREEEDDTLTVASDLNGDGDGDGDTETSTPEGNAELQGGGGAAAAPAAVPVGGQLPFTGFDVPSVLTAAGMLLALGGTSLALGNRRA